MADLTAFQVTEEDIANVLHDYALRVANTQGQSFEAMASELIHEIDHGRVEQAALNGGDDITDQTKAASREIRKILVEDGVIEF